MSKDRPDFGRYLAEAIAERGYPTPTDFARDAEISPSSVSRWIRGIERPSVRLLERIAPKLARDVRELVAVAYPEGMDADTPPPVDRPAAHALALELGRMLAEDSPLSDDQRQTLTVVIDHAVGPYRPYMRRRRSA